MPAICVEPRPALMLYSRTSLMVRSGRSAGLTPAPCAAASPGLASDETAAAGAPGNPRRELVFDIVASRGCYSPRFVQCGDTTGWQAKAPAPQCSLGDTSSHRWHRGKSAERTEAQP